MLYQGAVDPSTVNFVENMTLDHQRNLLLFNPVVVNPTPVQRCWYWWQCRRLPQDPVIIVELEGQLRLVSGAWQWLALGSQQRSVSVAVYTQRPWPLPESLALVSADQFIDKQQIQHSRARFDFFEQQARPHSRLWQLRLVYRDRGLQAQVNLGQGQQIKTVDYGYTAMESLSRLFKLADSL